MDIITWPQYRAQEYASLRTEYPSASAAECMELAGGITRRGDWLQHVTAALRAGTPTKRQWKSLLRDLGAEYIARRVFHDQPESAQRYLRAGLLLPAMPEC